MRRVVRSAFPIALIAVLAGLLTGPSGAGGVEPSCFATAQATALELVYRLDAGGEEVPVETRSLVAEILCKRLQALGMSGAEVTVLGGDEIRVGLPQATITKEAIDSLGANGELAFYEWETNLVGGVGWFGGHPGRRPPAGALREATREWKAAGRNVKAARHLIREGAMPTLFAAVKLASRQPPRRSCAACSASTPRFYMFDRSSLHRPIAGPVGSRETLRALTTGEAGAQNGIVLEVPVGTTVVSEPPTDSNGEPVTNFAPAWYALQDRVALFGSDVVDPRAERDGLGRQIVSFAFTEAGQTRFQRLTRGIARRGWERADGRISQRRAEELAGSLAIVFDDELKVRPIIDFTQFPQGIDGRTGAFIDGFRSAAEARRLATLLRIGALPVPLVLVREAVPA